MELVEHETITRVSLAGIWQYLRIICENFSDLIIARGTYLRSRKVYSTFEDVLVLSSWRVRACAGGALPPWKA